MDQQEPTYEAAWMDGEADAPLSDAVVKAKEAASDAVRDEFAAAFNETDDQGNPVARPAQPGAEEEPKDAA